VGELHRRGAKTINRAAVDTLGRHTERTEEPYLVSSLNRNAGQSSISFGAERRAEHPVPGA